MGWLVLGSRLVLGAVFLFFGLNFFFNWFAPPPPETAAAKAFMTGLAGSGYFFPFLKGTEIVCGLLLLINRFVPLALMVLAPILINIILYHRLAAGGPPMDIILTILAFLAAYEHRQVLKPVFSMHG